MKSELAKSIMVYGVSSVVAGLVMAYVAKDLGISLIFYALVLAVGGGIVCHVVKQIAEKEKAASAERFAAIEAELKEALEVRRQR